MTFPLKDFWARLLTYPKKESNTPVTEFGNSAGDVEERLMEIGRRYAALPDTKRTPEEILGYDDNGLQT